MKRKHWTILILWGLIITGAAIWMTYQYGKTNVAGPRRERGSPAVQGLIAVSRPVLRSFSLEIPWTGLVQSQATVELIAPVPGYVVAIQAADQKPLKAGALILRLGGIQIESQQNRLQAQIKSLQSQLDLAGQSAERLQRSLEEKLATKDEVAAARETQLKLESQLSDALLSLASLRKEVCITAPRTGVFTNRKVNSGQAVNSGDVLGEIVDPKQLRIVASLFPPEGTDLEGRKTTIHLGENRMLYGLIRHILPQASTTGARMVWIEGPALSQYLYPGQTAQGTVVVEVRPAALTVPESAIVFDSEEHPYLFVHENSIYQPRAVQLGLTRNGWVEVLSGLKKNQCVVTQGAYELFYRRFNEQFRVQD